MNAAAKGRKSNVLSRAWPGAAVLVFLGCAAQVRPTEDDTNSLQPGSAGATGGSPGAQMTNVEGNEGAEESLSPAGLVETPAAEDSQSAGQNQTCGTGDAGACPPILLCAGDSPECESTCPGCFIEGSCIADGAVNPGNACLSCEVARDARAWSTNDGTTCDDGLFCTVSDICTEGACRGAVRECEDGVECNGTSACDEAADACSLPASQCGDEAVCDVATDSCRSTCDGCIVSGVCVLEGAEAPGNPCQVCDPSRSTTTYSIAAGKSCGSAATVCSGQDTCDVEGRCQPNHLSATTPCGSQSASACDQADGCDGNGNCQQRTAPNGSPCDDGAFCSTGDQCQAGQCVAAGQQNCGANRTCNEAANQCQCQGCQVGNTCFAAGAVNPANPCQVCNPANNATGFSANTDASCGSPATECSGQDTCNAQGQCVANDRANGSACTSAAGGSCQNGQCAGCNGCRIGGSCVLPGAVNPQNPCQVCNPASNTTGFSVNAGANCGTGQTPCSGQDTCNAQGQCVANDLQNGSACNSPPGGSCAAGNCVAARQALGTVCTAASQCQSGFCRLWFEDLDEDSFGNGQRRAMLCSPSPEDDDIRGNSGLAANIRVLSAGGIQYSERGDDCCDVVSGRSDNVRPFNSGFFSLPQVACLSVDPFDYDCSGSIDDSLNNRSALTSGCPASCDRDIWAGVIPQCGQNGLIQQCRMIDGVCTPGTTFTALRNCR